MVCVLEKLSFQKCFLSILNRKADLFRFTHIFKIFTLPPRTSPPLPTTVYISYFEAKRDTGSRQCRNASWDCFGDAWLLRGYAENWSKFARPLPLQFDPTQPVSCPTSRWAISHLRVPKPSLSKRGLVQMLQYVSCACKIRNHFRIISFSLSSL